VNLVVEEGEFFSGCSAPTAPVKTTLISILAGLGAAPIAEPSPCFGPRCGHGFPPSAPLAGRGAAGNSSSIRFFTVRESLRIQSGYFGLRKNDDWIDEIMANLDLTEKADVNTRALSGGNENVAWPGGAGVGAQGRR